ncbi:MAG: hypothetical protein ACJAUH_000989 [Saprospiraceae bacterium]|jgi:hypothetical protein
MKKVLIMLIAITFLQQSVSAQVFSWGLRLGGVSTSIDATPQTLSTANIDSLLLTVANANFGIQGGLYTRIKLGPVYIQPELLFTSESYNYTKEDLNGSGVQEALTDKFNSLDIPIMVGVKAGPIRLQGGPIGSILISNDNQLEMLSETYDRKLSNLTWGYQAGLGLDIGSVNIDVKYEGGLKSAFVDDYEIFGNTYEFDARENRWVLTIGLKF